MGFHALIEITGTGSRDTAFDVSWGPTGKDAEYGWGVINARAAVTKACTTIFTDATNRTNICKTDAGGNATPPNEDPEQPPHSSRPDEDLAAGEKVDKWTLTIDDVAWPIAATLIMPNWPTTSFNLKLEHPTDGFIANSTELTRQDTLATDEVTPIFPSTTGDYIIHVVNPGGSAGDYWLDVSAGGALEAAPSQDQ